MKILATLVLVTSIGAMGCSSSDQANARGNDTELAATTYGSDTKASNAGSSTSTATTTAKTTVKKRAKGLGSAPEWKAFDVTGEEVSSKDYAGKIQIVDFWATWCGPCKLEIPHFIELQKKYKDDLVVIGMALDSVQKVVPFSKRFAINYVNLIGDNQIIRDFGVGRSIPTTYVVDQQGEIYKRYVGYRPKEVFIKDIQDLLANAAK